MLFWCWQSRSSTMLIVVSRLHLKGSTPRVKPIITVYSGENLEETKKFEGFITAAFWIGFDHSEGDVSSVRVRQPNESYDTDVAELTEFATLLVQRQINFSVEFFSEPVPQSPQVPMGTGISQNKGSRREESKEEREGDYEAELSRIKEEYRQGILTQKQYDAKKEALLKKWKESVEGTLRR